jgi:hypothetical protein
LHVPLEIHGQKQESAIRRHRTTVMPAKNQMTTSSPTNDSLPLDGAGKPTIATPTPGTEAPSAKHAGAKSPPKATKPTKPAEVLVLIHHPRLAQGAKAAAHELLPLVGHFEQPQPTEHLHDQPIVVTHTEEDEFFDGRTLNIERSQSTFTPVYTSVLKIARDGHLATYERVENHQLVSTQVEAPEGFIWTAAGDLQRESDGECYQPSVEQLEAAPPDLGERVTSEIDSRIWVRVCTLAENAAEQHHKS